MEITINSKKIGSEYPVYFIADLASNHGGNLSKARELVHACAESGVDAVKMQNFEAKSLVSDIGFRHLQGLITHQSSWNQSVYESYKAASIPVEWTLELKSLCERLKLDYLTSPYSIDLAHAVSNYVTAFKIGSGDITWLEEIEEISRMEKPVFIATGASTMQEVELAMKTILKNTKNVLLMQCNTDYTAKVDEIRERSLARFRNINLRVLETYRSKWPNMQFGLSDHTHGHLTVLGAVGLFDCSAVEKHFTLDNRLEGQDHAFSMTPADWRKMVKAAQDLKNALQNASTWDERYSITRSAVDDPDALDLAIGDGIKRVEPNEQATVIVQRRAIRAAHNLQPGDMINKADLVVLRPCPSDALPPYRIGELVGKTMTRPILEGDCVRLSDVC